MSTGQPLSCAANIKVSAYEGLMSYRPRSDNSAMPRREIPKGRQVRRARLSSLTQSISETCVPLLSQYMRLDVRHDQVDRTTRHAHSHYHATFWDVQSVSGGEKPERKETISVKMTCQVQSSGNAHIQAFDIRDSNNRLKPRGLTGRTSLHAWPQMYDMETLKAGSKRIYTSWLKQYSACQTVGHMCPQNLTPCTITLRLSEVTSSECSGTSLA
ncbi:hypothetical protein GQ53DRAFT_767360 [Thozetella sp. PMI_491]|nr:hypothetical protein GQ53DRAFT_767360 [Thozetella sp. PMI_491]